MPLLWEETQVGTGCNPAYLSDTGLPTETTPRSVFCKPANRTTRKRFNQPAPSFRTHSVTGSNGSRSSARSWNNFARTIPFCYQATTIRSRTNPSRHESGRKCQPPAVKRMHPLIQIRMQILNQTWRLELNSGSTVMSTMTTLLDYPRRLKHQSGLC